MARVSSKVKRQITSYFCYTCVKVNIFVNPPLKPFVKFTKTPKRQNYNSMMLQLTTR